MYLFLCFLKTKKIRNSPVNFSSTDKIGLGKMCVVIVYDYDCSVTFLISLHILTVEYSTL